MLIECRKLNVECQMANFECRMSNVECQMSNVNKVNLLSERTSGVPPVFFFIQGHINGIDCYINVRIHMMLCKQILTWKSSPM